MRAKSSYAMKQLTKPSLKVPFKLSPDYKGQGDSRVNIVQWPGTPRWKGFNMSDTRTLLAPTTFSFTPSKEVKDDRTEHS